MAKTKGGGLAAPKVKKPSKNPAADALRQRQQAKQPAKKPAKKPAKQGTKKAGGGAGTANPLDSTLYSPGTVLAGRDLRRSVNSLVKGEVQSALGGYDREIAQQKASGDVVQQRLAGLGQAQAGENALAQQRLGGSASIMDSYLKDLSDKTQGRITQAGDDAKARLESQQLGSLAGLQGDQGARMQAELAAQSGRAATDSQATGFRFANDKANAELGQQGFAQASQMQNQEAMRDAAARTQSNVSELLGKRTEAQAKEGPLKTKLLLQLRQSGFENLATLMANQLKVKDLQQEAQQASADNTLARQKLRADINDDKTKNKISWGNLKQNQLEEAGRNERASLDRDLRKYLDENDGDTSGLTPTQKRQLRENISKAVGTVKAGAKELENGKSVSWTSLLEKNPGKYTPIVRQMLRSKYGKAVGDRALKQITSGLRGGGRPPTGTTLVDPIR